MQKYDIVVIGAGAVGCAIAYELSKYNLTVLVVDENSDIGGDASRANSALIHSGYDTIPGSMENLLAVASNPIYERLSKELDIPYSKVGALLPAITDEQLNQLYAIKKKSFDCRLYNIEYLDKKRVLEMEPNINPDVKAALYVPDEGIIDPFILVVALAENAHVNGARFETNAKVLDIIKEKDKVVGIVTEKGEFYARYVINAAGLHNDEIANMVGKADYVVKPRKGEFYILDKKTSCKVNKIILPVPTKITKGKLIAPTVHGNFLVGPTADDIDDKTNLSTTREGLESIIDDVKKLVPNIQINDTITQYAGLRPFKSPEGVTIDKYDDLMGYINISGVRSTGVTISVGIGKYIAQMLFDMGEHFSPKTDYNPYRKGIVKFSELSIEGKEAIIKENPLYGNVICRCETVTEAEIVEAIHRDIPATSLDAVKRRLRSGLGRCQGGFCGPKIMEILARELNIPIEEVKKNGPKSYTNLGNLR